MIWSWCNRHTHVVSLLPEVNLHCSLFMMSEDPRSTSHDTVLKLNAEKQLWKLSGRVLNCGLLVCKFLNLI